MAASIQPTDSGAGVYDVLGDAATYTGQARNAIDTIAGTAYKPLGVLDYLLPPMLFFRLGYSANADMTTASGRAALKGKLDDLHGKLATAADEAAALGDNPVGADRAAAWNALLADAETVGAKITAEIKRVQAAVAPYEKIADAPGNALTDLGLGAGGALQGAGKGARGVLDITGTILRWLPLLLLLGVVGLVAVLFIKRIPQKWIASRRKG